MGIRGRTRWSPNSPRGLRPFGSDRRKIIAKQGKHAAHRGTISLMPRPTIRAGDFTLCEMWAFERLRKWHEEKPKSWKLRSEHLFLAHGAMAVDLPRDCIDWIPSRRHS